MQSLCICSVNHTRPPAVLSMHVLQGWIDQAAEHMKSVDPNHMVTVGEEGFYGFGASAAELATNPNSDNTG